MKNQLNIPINRLKHCYGVAKVMEFLSQEANESPEKQQQMFMLGYNHDAAYDYENERTPYDLHSKIAAQSLSGWAYNQEILYHNAYVGPDTYSSKELDWLYLSDMMVAGDGREQLIVPISERLLDLKNRHGENSRVYKESEELVDYLYSKDYSKVEQEVLKHFGYIDVHQQRVDKANQLGESILGKDTDDDFSL